MAVSAHSYVSPEEYLRLERASEGRKCEYLDGQIFAMAGTSYVHFTICSNLVLALGNRLRGTPCTAGGSDLKVRTPSNNAYSYPDIVIVCGKPRFHDEHTDVLLNPIGLIEVLSPSTESYDRGLKFERYRTIDSLREYVLVSQDHLAVEVFERGESSWQFRSYSPDNPLVRFECVNLEIPIQEVYDRVSLP